MTRRSLTRRRFVGLAGGVVAAAACGHPTSPQARVVVVGGGFAGATAAKYLRRLAPAVAVTLVEVQRTYVCCPFSNAVLGGLLPLERLRRDYALLAARHGIEVIHRRVVDIAHERREVRLGGGERLGYDRLIVAPGIRLRWGAPEGYDARAAERMPHAWQAGPQTELLRRHLEAMPDGGTVVISVPRLPFRCPPGPYERASLVAAWLARRKPRSKVLILDANEDFTKRALFEEGWRARYPGRIEWVPLSADGAVRRVDARTLTLFTELGEHRAAAANVIPPQAAGEIAERAGLTDATGWCPIDPETFESTRVSGVHVLGDAAIAAPMPKSASAANSQGKLCALYLAAYFSGRSAPPPSLHNTCYSLVDDDYGISVSAVYRVEGGIITGIEGAGGVSPAGADARFRAAEARYARGWFDSITADTFG